jgi:transposase-like protein
MIWLYLQFTLSLRDVEDLLTERGILRDRSALGESFRAHDRGGAEQTPAQATAPGIWMKST